MRNLDFSSWEAVATTFLGLVAVTIVMVSVRLVIMQTVQQRRERENRQINERLRTLIAAYRTLGGSFTGDLAVDPTHLRDLMRTVPTTADAPTSSDRARRIRDAVEGALSDVILLGTEDQVRLAARAAAELVAGRPVHTAELVVSLRDFIRSVLDLGPVPSEVVIPRQGPTRPGPGGGKGKGNGEGGDKGGGKGDKAGDGMDGGGMGLGMGFGFGHGADEHEGH